MTPQRIRICSVLDCGRTHYARGYCWTHFGEMRRRADVLDRGNPQVCLNCGRGLTDHRQIAYCSRACREAGYQRTTPTKSHVGVLSELRASIDLMHRGFEIYRPINYVNASCDLVAIRKAEVLRVEVKTGTLNPQTGRISFKLPQEATKYDVLAIVTNDEVIYDPPLLEPVSPRSVGADANLVDGAP